MDEVPLYIEVVAAAASQSLSRDPRILHPETATLWDAERREGYTGGSLIRPPPPRRTL